MGLMRFKRGVIAKLKTLLPGEPAFTLDTKQLFVGSDNGNVEFASKEYVDSRASNSVHGHVISDVANLQSTLDGKAPSAHSHAISDVTNLQTTLNGKSDTTHNHDTVYVPKTSASNIVVQSGLYSFTFRSDAGFSAPVLMEGVTRLDAKYSLNTHVHGVFNTTTDGFVPKSVTSNTTDFLRRDGTWATPPGGGDKTAQYFDGNLDTLITPGWYWDDGGNNPYAPGEYGHVEVMSYNVSANETRIVQHYTSDSIEDFGVWERTGVWTTAGGYWWNAWLRVAPAEQASTVTSGNVMLSTSINSTSTTTASTPSAVKQAYDLANGKESAITAGTTAQYFRGDKTWQTLNSASISDATNLSTANMIAKRDASGGCTFDSISTLKAGGAFFASGASSKASFIGNWVSANYFAFGAKDSSSTSAIKIGVTDSAGNWQMTQPSLWIGNAQVLDTTGNVTTTSPETGYCGVGVMNSTSTTGTIAGVGVNFRIKRTSAPSSVTLTSISNNVGSIATLSITVDGFWLYINGTASATYQYWRGTYTV